MATDIARVRSAYAFFQGKRTPAGASAAQPPRPAAQPQMAQDVFTSMQKKINELEAEVKSLRQQAQAGWNMPSIATPPIAPPPPPPAPVAPPVAPPTAPTAFEQDLARFDAQLTQDINEFNAQLNQGMSKFERELARINQQIGQVNATVQRQVPAVTQNINGVVRSIEGLVKAFEGIFK